MILASTGPERRFGQRPPCRPWSLPHADTRAECAARPKETAHPPGQKMSPAHPGRQPARLVLVRRAHPSAARRCAQGTLVGLTRPFECSGHVLIARADAIHARTLLLIACSHPWWCRCPSAQRPRRRGARLCPCRATVPVRRLGGPDAEMRGDLSPLSCSEAAVSESKQSSVAWVCVVRARARYEFRVIHLATKGHEP